uniref:Putative secreted protein n=1 Tax=Anopheles darlingi TaxID=43151 RepID=A0A2M4D0U2_ANODA
MSFEFLAILARIFLVLLLLLFAFLIFIMILLCAHQLAGALALKCPIRRPRTGHQNRNGEGERSEEKVLLFSKCFHVPSPCF